MDQVPYRYGHKKAALDHIINFRYGILPYTVLAVTDRKSLSTFVYVSKPASRPQYLLLFMKELLDNGISLGGELSLLLR
jgi:hypothetical protein